MKKLNLWVVLVGLLTCCKNSQVPINDVACLRIVNKEITMDLKAEMGAKYDSLEDQIKLAIKFFMEEGGRIDSPAFVGVAPGHCAKASPTKLQTLKFVQTICYPKLPR